MTIDREPRIVKQYILSIKSTVPLEVDFERFEKALLIAEGVLTLSLPVGCFAEFGQQSEFVKLRRKRIGEE